MDKKRQIVEDIHKLLLKLVDEEMPKNKKPTSVWDLSEKDECWIISGKGKIVRYSKKYGHFTIRRAKGDMFLSKQHAEKELAIRVSQALTSIEGMSGSWL